MTNLFLVLSASLKRFLTKSSFLSIKDEYKALGPKIWSYLPIITKKDIDSALL